MTHSDAIARLARACAGHADTPLTPVSTADLREALDVLGVPRAPLRRYAAFRAQRFYHRESYVAGWRWGAVCGAIAVLLVWFVFAV